METADRAFGFSRGDATVRLGLEGAERRRKDGDDRRRLLRERREERDGRTGGRRKKFLDVNTPLDDAFNLQMDASSLFYKMKGELQRRFEDLLKATTDNDIPRGGNY
ncbi:uncharacterized protein LOC116403190 isoform X2 [Cucumis sativus]|uniref:uncharacterized protein LOC116403190 isoform X2 n=1 Tax=Cucumis sativus TaxID=3659 RepID=UPI0012F4D970|nr:uncharacterized protein LOC116403190 isoform X2 [Cucumis sativus]